MDQNGKLSTSTITHQTRHHSQTKLFLANAEQSSS